MDKPREGAGRKRLIKRVVIGIFVISVLGDGTVRIKKGLIITNRIALAGNHHLRGDLAVQQSGIDSRPPQLSVATGQSCPDGGLRGVRLRRALPGRQGGAGRLDV